MDRVTPIGFGRVPFYVETARFDVIVRLFTSFDVLLRPFGPRWHVKIEGVGTA